MPSRYCRAFETLELDEPRLGPQLLTHWGIKKQRAALAQATGNS